MTGKRGSSKYNICKNIMIKINLLSPDDRLNSKWEKIGKIIISSATAVIITQLIFVFLIFVSIKYLEIENNSLNKQLENLRLGTKAKEIIIMQNDIKNYGSHLERVDQIWKDHLCWTKAIEDFSEIIPDEVKIKKIYIEEYKDNLKKEDKKNKKNDGDKYKIIIKGEARKKDYLEHLLKFENNLKESEIFELIVDNYLEKNYISDADFEFRVLIDRSNVVVAGS